MFICVDRHIKLLKVPNNGNFPYCTCAFIDDRSRVLIDSGCGSKLAHEVSQYGLDILINTHFHSDHNLNTGELGAVQTWCHELDAPPLRSLDEYMDYYGFNLFQGHKLGLLLAKHFNYVPRPVHRELKDGELLDFGHVKLRVIHTPGHTPGHCCFFEEQKSILFSADIELGPYGLWYSHLCSDLDKFIASIEKCMELQPKLIVSGHSGIIEGDFNTLFLKCRDQILKKEEKILKSIEKPSTVELLSKQHSFSHPKLEFGQYTPYFNKHGVYKHLERLVKHGEIKREGDIYFKI
jgi:glyoxylase-like metal-dependent hydrolase (beta-lactamase superfamily II)